MTANILAAICVYCITRGNTRGKIYDVHCQTVFLYWHISQKSLHCIYSIVLIKSVIQTLHQPKFYRGHNKQKTYQPFNYPLLSAWFYICWWYFLLWNSTHLQAYLKSKRWEERACLLEGSGEEAGRYQYRTTDSLTAACVEVGCKAACRMADVMHPCSVCLKICLLHDLVTFQVDVESKTKSADTVILCACVVCWGILCAPSWNARLSPSDCDTGGQSAPPVVLCGNNLHASDFYQGD